MNPLELISTDPSVNGSMDVRLGICALKLACWAPDLTSAMLAPPPAVEVPGLVEWQPRSFSRNRAGDQAGYDVLVTLEGHVDPEKADEEYYEMDASLADDPIESHWNLDVLLAVYGNGKKPDPQTGRMVWPRKLPAGEGNLVAGNSRAATNPMAGVESWRNPGLIWTRNWVAPTLPATIVQELGTIHQKLPGNPTKLQQPPGLHGSRDWLGIRVRARQRGNIWQLASSYELSGPFGWVPEMYSYV